jgi:hypothetical protein
MPAFGITNSTGLTAPAGYMQEITSEESVDVATIKDETGVVKVAQAKPLTTKTVSIKCKGQVSLATIAGAADFSGITITSTKVSETNDDFPTSEVTGMLYS